MRAEPADVDYFTTPLTEKETEILEVLEERTRRRRCAPGSAGSRSPSGWWASSASASTARRRSTSTPLDLPPVEFETVGLWWAAPRAIEETLRRAGEHFMGSLHASEHAAISLLPAARALRPRGHRRHLLPVPPAGRLRRGLHLRRPSRRRGDRGARLRGPAGAARPGAAAARGLPLRDGLPVLHPVAQVRQRQPAAGQGRARRGCSGCCWERRSRSRRPCLGQSRRAVAAARGGARGSGADLRDEERPPLVSGEHGEVDRARDREDAVDGRPRRRARGRFCGIARPAAGARSPASAGSAARRTASPRPAEQAGAPPPLDRPRHPPNGRSTRRRSPPAPRGWSHALLAWLAPAGPAAAAAPPAPRRRHGALRPRDAALGGGGGRLGERAPHGGRDRRRLPPGGGALRGLRRGAASRALVAALRAAAAGHRLQHPALRLPGALPATPGRTTRARCPRSTCWRTCTARSASAWASTTSRTRRWATASPPTACSRSPGCAQGGSTSSRQYCRHDVEILRDLYLHGRREGFLLYRDRKRDLRLKLRVDW